MGSILNKFHILIMSYFLLKGIKVGSSSSFTLFGKNSDFSLE